MDLAQIQREGKLAMGCFPSMENVVGETHGRATGGGFDATAFHERWLLRAIRFTVVLTFAHAVMAKCTETQDSYMSAVDKRFPPHELARPSQRVSGGGCRYFHYTDVETEAQMNRVARLELRVGRNGT